MRKILSSLFVIIVILLYNNSYLVYSYDDYIDFDNSQYIAQREAVKAECIEHLSLITTTSIGPCHFIILYDPEQKIGVAGHWDAGTKKEDIERYFEIFERSSSSFNNMEAYLIGGWIYGSGLELPLMLSEYIENAFLSRGITKINKDHLYEKTPFKPQEDEYISIEDMSKNVFWGLGFDVCTGTLKLKDDRPIRNHEHREPNLCTDNPLQKDIPYSGCSLKFIPSKRIKTEL